MRKTIFGLILLTALIDACTTVSRNEIEDVRVVLLTFENSLKKPDSVVLKQFHGNQERYQILGAANLLRNRDSATVRIRFFHEESKILWGNEDRLTLTVPVELESIKKGTEKSSFSLRLFRKEKKFYIEEIDAQELHRKFYSLRDEIINGKELEKRLAIISVHLQRAKEIQKTYDSVVGYADFKGRTYYYVVNGHYGFESLREGSHKFKMGLVNQEGEEIVPVEFDLVGNPGINLKDGVEVTKEGKVGYYSLNENAFIPAEYNWIISYEHDNVIAIAKKDSLFGWIDKECVFNYGFPSDEARSYVMDYQFITESNLSLGSEYQCLINILFMKKDDLYRATGIVITPSYLVDLGFFKSVETNFLSTSDAESQVYLDGNAYTEVKSQGYFSLSETVTAMISTFKTRYIGGRGEFYKRNKIILTGPHFELISCIETRGGDDFGLKKMEGGLFEARFSDSHNFGYYDPNLDEQNFPYFEYFRFDGKVFTKLKSDRRFSFTEFVRMDSTYLQGEYVTFTRNTGSGSSRFASEKTLEYMRDEILASYGFIFSDPDRVERFKYLNWYKPSIDSYDEVFSKASEIDRHNLNFLAGLIGDAGSF